LGRGGESREAGKQRNEEWGESTNLFGLG